MSNIILRQIRRKDMHLILTLDKKVYPISSPVNENVLCQWYARNPEFGMIYEKNGKIIAVCVVIPLNAKAWNKFVDGKLSEAQLAGKCIFDSSKDDKLALHVYHLEKLDSSLNNLHLKFLGDLSCILQKLKVSNKKLRVIGLSGLCTTNKGIRLFTEVFGCKENRYISDEYVLKNFSKNACRKYVKTSVCMLRSKKELDNKLKKSYKLINRCRLLVTTPGEKSLVWRYLK